MTPVDFTIPGQPIGKARPRATAVNGRPRMYTPKTTADYEKQVAKEAKPLFPAPLACAVRLRVVAFFAMPQSWSKKKRAALEGQFHTQKPDADNVLKVIKDGLNEVAWIDDAQVCDARVVKRWANYGETFVQIGDAT